MRKCSVNNESVLLNKINSYATLYLPVDAEKNRVIYKKYEDGDKVSKALKTDRSAKDFFFPQTENLMQFKTEGKNIEIIDNRVENEDYIIFGVKSCDAKSFKILDRVFLADPVDSYYENRRNHATVVVEACFKPSETCFCRTFDIDPLNPDGDVVMYRTETDYYFDAKTEKGNKFIEAIKDITVESEENELDALKENAKKVFDKLPLASLKKDAFGKDKTNEYFNRPEWDKLSESCLGCGTCTFVCPTCQCYDIKDYNTGKGVQRFRCWDSCMYHDFTKMSAGQPRLTQKERFRQRFMHKLVYFPTNNDNEFGCVGCGRCVAKCPISMNIAKVMKALGGKEND